VVGEKQNTFTGRAPPEKASEVSDNTPVIVACGGPGVIVTPGPSRLPF
jgi:hypothetical protein